jgi:hypothetical protein
MLLVLFGCGKSEQQLAQEKAVSEALSALQKVQAATEVGVSYQQYGIILIDAKAKVNEASSKITDDSLKKLLNEPMDAYADAQMFWGYKIKDTSVSAKGILPDGRDIKTLISKYKIKPDGDYVDKDDAMQGCWLYASTQLKKAVEVSKPAS